MRGYGVFVFFVLDVLLDRSSRFVDFSLDIMNPITFEIPWEMQHVIEHTKIRRYFPTNLLTKVGINISNRKKLYHEQNRK